MAVNSYLSPLSEIALRNLKLLETGHYHDFVIKCGSREFKVHRNIVCPQSVMLASLCDPTWKEGSEGCANLKEEDPEIVEKALRFLYTGYYDRECPCGVSPVISEEQSFRITFLESQKAPGQAFLSDVRVYVLADYLDVEGLKLQALQNCTHHLTCHFDSAEFLEPITAAISNTKSDDSGLRRQILRSCVEKSAVVKSCPQLERLLQDQEPLAWSLLLEAQERQGEQQKLLEAAQAEALAARIDLQHRTRDVERAHDNLRASVKLVNATKQCRNETCDKDFGASLETYANGYIKGLRCKRCKCRHSMT